jgi:TldD protein
MISHNLAREALDAALARGGHFADLFLEDATHHGMMLRGGKVETANTSRLHGAGVRVFAGDQFYYVYTNDTGREGLLRCARRAADAVSGSRRTASVAAPALNNNNAASK